MAGAKDAILFIFTLPACSSTAIVATFYPVAHGVTDGLFNSLNNVNCLWHNLHEIRQSNHINNVWLDIRDILWQHNVRCHLNQILHDYIRTPQFTCPIGITETSIGIADLLIRRPRLGLRDTPHRQHHQQNRHIKPVHQFRPPTFGIRDCNTVGRVWEVGSNVSNQPFIAGPVCSI
jgi:hypothetical protein